MLNLFSTPVWFPKAGNAPDEYEDAFQPARRGEQRGPILRFAVADGATEGVLSGRWAALLCKHYRRRWQDAAQAPEWIERAVVSWEAEKEHYLLDREARGEPVQWYEEPGLASGAFSTLLGVTLRPAPDGMALMEAISLGDSCLFQVRRQALILAFPFHRSADFNSRPILLCSNPARNTGLLDRLEVARGAVAPLDRLYLMTDALAAWFLRDWEAGGMPWQTVDSLSTPAEWSAWLADARQSRLVRNDDVTCLRLDGLTHAVA